MRIDWKPILLWGGGLGALFALWSGLWIVGFLVLWGNGSLYPDLDIPAEFAGFVRVPTDVALGSISRLLGLDLPTQPIAFLLLLTVLGTVAGAFVASVGRLSSLDQQSVGLHSLSWALRSTVSRSVAVASLIPVVPITLVALTDSEALWFLMVPIIPAVWFIPVLICRPGVVTDLPALKWWSPSWPGFKVMAVYLLIEFAVLALSYLLDLVPPHMLTLFGLTVLAWLALTAITPLFQGSFLMASASKSRWMWKSLFAWHTLGPWIALNLWWSLVLAFCLAPIISVYLWIWKVVPVLATILEGQGRVFPTPYLATINSINFFGNFGWMLVMIPTSFLYWFAAAKFVVLADLGVVEDLGSVGTEDFLSSLQVGREVDNQSVAPR